MKNLNHNVQGASVVMDRLNTAGVFLSGLALTAMAVMITVDIVLRYVFNSPLPATVEVSQLLEPYVVFLPFAYTLATARHVNVTLVVGRLPDKAALVTQVFVYSVDTVFFLLLLYYSWKEFWHSYVIGEIMFAAVRLPWWTGKFAMPLGIAMIAAQSFVCLLIVCRRIRELRCSIQQS